MKTFAIVFLINVLLCFLLEIGKLITQSTLKQGGGADLWRKRLKLFSLTMIFTLVLQLFSSAIISANVSTDALGVQSPIINSDGSVTFNYSPNQGETRAFVIGSFNNWDLNTAVEMTLENGVFTANLKDLSYGEHQYKFILNNRSWDQSTTDPLNPNQKDGNSVFSLVDNVDNVKIEVALMDAKDTIHLTVNTDLKDSDQFRLIENETNQEIPTTFTKTSSTQGTLTITDPTQVNVQNIYRVEADRYKGTTVIMRNILNDDSFYYEGNDLGYTYSPEKTTFKLWAPTAKKVSVAIYENAGKYDGAFVTDHTDGRETPMTRAENGVWSVTMKDDLKNKYYMYKVEFADGTTNYAVDPYARSTSANGQRGAIIDLNSTDPENFQPDVKPPFVSATDAVIYELHVRDFSINKNSGISEENKGKYLAFTETGTTGPNGIKTGIDSLKELGITHVHLLPVYDFGSVNELTVDNSNSKDPKFNWGYDPVHFNVPEGSYSTDPTNPTARVQEFKQMVQALHDQGIRVIMDVVYNHTYIPESSQLQGGSPFDLIVPGYYYRTDEKGKITNGSGTGNEVASERPMVRKYIKDSVKYWASEYGIDGFRFDLMGLIDKQTMTELTKELKEEVDPSILIYGEPWTGGTSSLDSSLQNYKGTQKDRGYAVFNDNFRSAIKGGSDDASAGFATGAAGREGDIVKGVKGAIDDFTNRASESINYVTAHDNLNLWDKIMKVANIDVSKSPHEIITEDNVLDNEYVKRSLLANGIVLTSQGIPFIHAGEEILRSKYGDHNSYKSPDSINMIRWELKDQYKPVFDYYQGLIELRKSHPAFRLDTKEAIEQNLQVIKSDGNIVVFELKNFANNDSWKNIIVIYNANNTTKEIALPSNSEWKVVVDDQKAGTETIRTINGNQVSVAPLSMMVLYDDAEEEYTPEVSSIDFNIDQIALNLGDTKTIVPYVKDQKGRILTGEKVTWSSSNDEVAKVVNGKIVALNEGDAILTATAGNVEATIKVYVTKLVPKTITIHGDSSVFESYSTQLSTVVRDQFDQEMLGEKIKWTSSDESVAVVVGTGKVTGKKPGTIVITATSGEAKATLTFTVKEDVKRYVRLKYVRPDKDFTDWNIWVWNTGVKNDQIDFQKYEGDTAIADIEISPTTESIGFLIRKGTDWNTAKISPDSDDHNIKIDKDSIITKVTVVTGVPGQYVVPTVKGPILEDGNVTFYYRDETLFANDAMDTIDDVKVKIAGKEYSMVYDKKNEYFSYTLQNLEPGSYEYSFLVTKDGTTSEVTDPKNTIDGKSTITYTIPSVSINAKTSPNKITYNENAVLSFDIDSEEKIGFQEMYADLTALGGPPKVNIDPQLQALTIAAADTVVAGKKEIKITLVDEFGNKHDQTVEIDVAPRTSVGELDFDWDEARIYFMLTDRFYDGDKSNNPEHGYDPTHSEAYHGGDFRGIIEKLDYLEDLGINTIWITPIVDNIDFNKGLDFKTVDGLEAKQFAYHGYWAKDFTSLDPTLGDIDTFKELIKKAHDRGIKIMVDVVLNHAGYGMKDIEETWKQDALYLPTDVERARLEGMLRDVDEDPVVRGELDHLPDLKTEDPAVRAKIIEWQTAWLEKARTDRGDTIDYFRVDTVKHVDPTTWMAFKNTLTAIDPGFKLIGEYWGASINNDGGYLRSGQMDSLLDFDFKEKAKEFLNGNIEGVEQYLRERNAKIDNTATFGQFLSSHDQNGFLSEYVNGDVGKLLVAAALQITSKGQPVIYYGEELGKSGKADWEKEGDVIKQFGQNRGSMPWDKYESGDQTAVAIHDHYKKLLNIRKDYSKIFSKGTRTFVRGGNEEQYSIFKREYLGDSLYVGLNTSKKAKEATFKIDYPAGASVTDLYSGQTYTVNDKGEITVKMPSRDLGGTIILARDQSEQPEVPGDTDPGDSDQTDPENPSDGGQKPIDPDQQTPESELKENVKVNATVKNGKVTIDDNSITILKQNGILIVEVTGKNIEFVLTKEQVRLLKEKGVSILLTNEDVSLQMSASVFPDSKVKVQMKRMKDIKEAVSAVYDFNILDENGAKITNLSAPVTITFEVGNDHLKELNVYYFNETKKQWELVPGAVYKEGKVSVNTTHFSTFTVSDQDLTAKTVLPEEGYVLPSTATNEYNLLVLGVILLAFGWMALYMRRYIKSIR